MRAIRRLLGAMLAPDPRKEWPRLLDSVSLGSGTRLAGARLVAREGRGCRLTIGDQSNVEGAIVFERADVSVRVGSRTHIGSGTLIDAALEIEIGSDVLIAFDVLLMDHDSHALDFAARASDVTEWVQGRKNWASVRTAPTRIGDKAWIGARAIVLRGVTIGEGAVIGAGSVVTQDVPAWSLAAGNPARTIRPLR